MHCNKPSKTNTLERVVVIGASGAGKTTLAAKLARLLNAPHVELDAYRHGPNWTETPDNIFRQNVADSLSGQRWVVDGNYSIARDIVWSGATAIIWLDYPFGLVFWRLFRRTLSRYIRRTELWNGNRENLKGVLFAKDSLFVWAFKMHWSRRKSLPIAFSQPQYSRLKVMRFRSPRAASKWLKSFNDTRAGQ